MACRLIFACIEWLHVNRRNMCLCLLMPHQAPIFEQSSGDGPGCLYWQKSHHAFMPISFGLRSGPVCHVIQEWKEHAYIYIAKNVQSFHLGDLHFFKKKNLFHALVAIRNPFGSVLYSLGGLRPLQVLFNGRMLTEQRDVLLCILNSMITYYQFDNNNDVPAWWHLLFVFFLLYLPRLAR